MGNIVFQQPANDPFDFNICFREFGPLNVLLRSVLATTSNVDVTNKLLKPDRVKGANP